MPPPGLYNRETLLSFLSTRNITLVLLGVLQGGFYASGIDVGPGLGQTERQMDILFLNSDKPPEGLCTRFACGNWS